MRASRERRGGGCSCMRLALTSIKSRVKLTLIRLTLVRQMTSTNSSIQNAAGTIMGVGVWTDEMMRSETWHSERKKNDENAKMQRCEMQSDNGVVVVSLRHARDLPSPNGGNWFRLAKNGCVGGRCFKSELAHDGQQVGLLERL